MREIGGGDGDDEEEATGTFYTLLLLRWRVGVGVGVVVDAMACRVVVSDVWNNRRNAAKNATREQGAGGSRDPSFTADMTAV